MEGFRSPLRKSFNKNQGSSPGSSEGKKNRKTEEEERLILLQNRNDPMNQSFNTDEAPKPELIVKVDGGDTSASTTKPEVTKAAHYPTVVPATGDGGIWRGSSYDFRNDNIPGAKSAGSTSQKDADFSDNSSEFDFQKHKEKTPEETMDIESQSLSSIEESPNEYGKMTPKSLKVSFKESELTHRHSGAVNDGGEREDEVVRCSSNSFQRKPTLMKTKTKSRLLDPPEEAAPRSGILKTSKRSGFIGNTPHKSGDIEEEDPFFDEDLPEGYKTMKLSVFTVLQWVSSIIVIAALVCSLTIPYLEKITLWDMRLWKWEVMILVLICGGLISGWLIRVVVFFIERNFLLRKRVLYFVYGLRKAVQNTLWLGWVLLAWNLILDKKVEKETKSKYLHFITKILVCLLAGTLIWLVKTVLLKSLATSFHVTAFFDRIQDALFNQYVIETLSGPPLIELQRIQEEEERVIAEVKQLQNAGAHMPADLRANCMPNNDGNNNNNVHDKGVGSGRSAASGLQRSPLIGKTPKSAVIGRSPRFSRSSSKKEEVEDGISIDHLHRMNQKNVSAWNMKRLMNIVRNGALGTLDERVMESGVDQDESAVSIQSEKQAKAAAKRIFLNVARPGSKFIFMEDLLRFMKEDEAERTLRFFEGSPEKKGISKKALKNWVVNVFRERRALALSLNDTKTAVKKLHHLLNVLVGCIIVVIWLLILGVPITHFLLFFSSQLLLLTFMFGNTFKTTFEAIIFLFVMHPFDVGDRCEIEGTQMVVEEMNILTTVFLRYDNQKIIYPNSVLSTKPIANYYRSPDMGDFIDFHVHVSTPAEKIGLMKERITTWVDNKSDHWYPSPMIVVRDIEDMNRLKISVWLSHTMNHQDMGERWVRRAILVEEMIKIFRDLDIEYRMLPMDVNLRTMPALSSDRLPSTWTTCGR